MRVITRADTVKIHCNGHGISSMQPDRKKQGKQSQSQKSKAPLKSRS